VIGMSGIQVRVEWTRAELTAVKETVELTPRFDGRTEVRNALRAALRPGRAPRPIVLELETAERFAGRFVTTDLPTALAKVKLLRAVRDAHELAASSTAPGDLSTEAA
jgi:hypothetical protein